MSPNMGCRIMCGRQTRHAFTLVEMMIAGGLATLVVLVVTMFSFYSSRSFLAAVNYVELDQQSQMALDKFSQQVRQVNQLTSYGTTNSQINSLTFQDYDGAALTLS